VDDYLVSVFWGFWDIYGMSVAVIVVMAILLRDFGP
jgi:hypothetical protein